MISTSFDKNVGVYLSTAFREGHAVHAYIVVGERQYLPSLLNECAIVTMCLNHVGDNCEACKKVKDASHQDVIRLPLDMSKARLTVADMSYLVEESYKRPVDDSEQRVFLVDASNSTSGVGSELWQNKLLKTLEEPTPNVYIFIGVTDAEALLPTVRSRCQILKQTKLSVEQVRDELLQKSFNLTSCEMAAAMSGGSVNTGERILANPDVFEAYNTAIRIATEMTSTKNALKYASQILNNKEYVNDCLGLLVALFRESIVLRLQPDLCLLPHLKDTIDQICSYYTLAACEICIEKINLAKKRLDDNGNVTVVVDQLLNTLLEIRYRCRK